MMKPGRIACEVPFCRRTAAAEKYEPGTRIICAKCWRLGDTEVRRNYSQAARRQKWWLKHRCWEIVLGQAIERRAGISG